MKANKFGMLRTCTCTKSVEREGCGWLGRERRERKREIIGERNNMRERTGHDLAYSRLGCEPKRGPLVLAAQPGRGEATRGLSK